MTQTVLVTGATGFLGSHLVRRLLQEGYRVVILKRSFSNTWRIEDVLPQLICYDIDKCDLEQPFQDVGKIDAVIHTATCYGRNQESLSSVLDANTVFPLRLLEIAIQFKVKTFLNTDTSLPKLLNDYSLSKKQFSEWGQYFSRLSQIYFVNIILEHIIGPKDDSSKFTTHVIRSCFDNIAELNLTDGAQKRDFIYIDDVVSAYTLLLDKAHQQAELCQNYELGSGEAVSIREFVETVHQMIKSKTVLKFGALPYRENEVMFSQANIERLKKLEWVPQYSWKYGVNSIINELNII